MESTQWVVDLSVLSRNAMPVDGPAIRHEVGVQDIELAVDQRLELEVVRARAADKHVVARNRLVDPVDQLEVLVRDWIRRGTAATVRPERADRPGPHPTSERLSSTSSPSPPSRRSDPRFAIKDVVARATLQVVVAIAAKDRVVIVAAVEHVIARAAFDRVVAPRHP